MFCIHGSPDNFICVFDDNFCWGENDWKVIDITRNRGAPTGKGKGRCMRACLTVDTIDVRSTSSFQGQGPWIYSEFSELTFLPRFMHANARSLVRQTLEVLQEKSCQIEGHMAGRRRSASRSSAVSATAISQSKGHTIWSNGSVQLIGIYYR